MLFYNGGKDGPFFKKLLRKKNRALTQSSEANFVGRAFFLRGQPGMVSVGYMARRMGDSLGDCQSLSTLPPPPLEVNAVEGGFAKEWKLTNRKVVRRKWAISRNELWTNFGESCSAPPFAQ